MLNDQTASTSQGDHNLQEDEQIRDIYALTPPHPPPMNRGRRREAWETSSHRSSSASEGAASENFTSMSREFSALVLAGSVIDHNNGTSYENEGANINGNNNLGRIGEEDQMPEEETNPLAIVPDNYDPLMNPIHSPRRGGPPGGPGSSNSTTTTTSSSSSGHEIGEISVHRVKKEEVESKISAWLNAKIAKLNNRFKREDAIINGWESEQVQKASSWMKKVERKLEAKRARALEKMQNDVAKARRKAEERRASAEAKRGTKVAKVLEVANLMRAVGRPPVKRSFF
ncbi:remorin 4.2-like isoform X1 [Carya illinoinensis]|uniref:Remorin C-terminal domain-containing protein n=1 Tax=Carya illinoinensis TaxID=32201 RepID=A0A8T1P1S5_CARIL|nr:remorin 4.2-like isoform X1 [Carya illinoinensis]KAG6638395.1 hypothetical protein CIPAW_10G032000 [Carya illinoinensis]KAG6638396.1 hypothetical protein CIPAW_10G032000 [Carya illinoinensis]